MRDPNRINKVIEYLRALWQSNPDMRLMQLLCNAVGDGPFIYYLEDDKLMEALKNCYEA